MFASDVYGLIEYCRYFYPLKSNESFELSDKDLSSSGQLRFEIYQNGIKKHSKNKLKKRTLQQEI